MNGIGFVLSKACCPLSNLCTSKKINVCRSNKINVCRSNKINFGSSNKTDEIPCRLSNLHHQRMSHSVATNAMLKHRVNASSAGKDVKGSRFELPQVSSAVVPYVLLGVGIIGMALGTARGVAAQIISTRGGIQGFSKSNACSYVIILGVAAVYLARGFLGNIMCGFTVLRNKPFSVGDMIEVGYMKGLVIEMGLINSSLLLAENRGLTLPTSWFYGQVIMNKSRETTVVPYSLLRGQVFVNKRRAPWHAMDSKIYLHNEDFEKVSGILDEIKNMMRSNPNVYLEEKQPLCVISGLERYCEISVECYLKSMNEDDLYLAKQDVLLQSAQIIKKHGARVAGHKGEKRVLTYLDLPKITSN